MDTMQNKNIGKFLLSNNRTLQDPSKTPDCSLDLQNGETIPAKFDWNAQGFISPVKAQGSDCGACFIFSGTASLESQHMIRSKRPNQPVQYSEQATVNCLKDSCHGGDPSKPSEYFVKTGVPLEKDLPYVGKVSLVVTLDKGYYHRL